MSGQDYFAFGLFVFTLLGVGFGFGMLFGAWIQEKTRET